MGGAFERTVFINCPFDAEYAALLEPLLYVVVAANLTPRLANESLDAGENRLDKICALIRSAKFSVHDLSRCRDVDVGSFNRMNMPFELGIDVGFRRSGLAGLREKRFLIFERGQYDLKRALSDIAGQDVSAHADDYKKVVKATREFLVSTAGLTLAGPTALQNEYMSAQGWIMQKKMAEGHSEEEAKSLPTRERLDEMRTWVARGKPATFGD